MMITRPWRPLSPTRIVRRTWIMPVSIIVIVMLAPIVVINYYPVIKWIIIRRPRVNANLCNNPVPTVWSVPFVI